MSQKVTPAGLVRLTLIIASGLMLAGCGVPFVPLI